MRSLFFCIIALACSLSSSAFVTIEPVSKSARDINIQIGKAGQQISLEDLSRINIKDFQKLTGEKMNLFEKVGFKLTQKRLRNNINADGSIHNKRFSSGASQIDGANGFHLLGFLLGMTGLIGILIVYILEDEKRKNRIKWAWIGFGVSALLGLIYILSMFHG